jgi:hypothetical protein
MGEAEITFDRPEKFTNAALRRSESPVEVRAESR